MRESEALVSSRIRDNFTSRDATVDEVSSHFCFWSSDIFRSDETSSNKHNQD